MRRRRNGCGRDFGLRSPHPILTPISSSSSLCPCLLQVTLRRLSEALSKADLNKLATVQGGPAAASSQISVEDIDDPAKLTLAVEVGDRGGVGFMEECWWDAACMGIFLRNQGVDADSLSLAAVATMVRASRR